jgi:hypothetical protein
MQRRDSRQECDNGRGSASQRRAREGVQVADPAAGADGLAGFGQAMRSIIAKAADAQIVLHTPVLVSQAARAYRAELPRYCQAVREIAADSGAVLVDHALAPWV